MVLLTYLPIQIVLVAAAAHASAIPQRYGAPQPKCTTKRVPQPTSYNCKPDQECQTKYEEQCQTEYEEQCQTKYEEQCQTEYEQKCETQYEVRPKCVVA